MVVQLCDKGQKLGVFQKFAKIDNKIKVTHQLCQLLLLILALSLPVK